LTLAPPPPPPPPGRRARDTERRRRRGLDARQEGVVPWEPRDRPTTKAGRASRIRRDGVVGRQVARSPRRPAGPVRGQHRAEASRWAAGGKSATLAGRAPRRCRRRGEGAVLPVATAARRRLNGLRRDIDRRECRRLMRVLGVASSRDCWLMTVGGPPAPGYEGSHATTGSGDNMQSCRRPPVRRVGGRALAAEPRKRVAAAGRSGSGR